ncbi:MAG: sigma-54-dependent transcriptional regulator [Sphingomonas sp.]
MLLGQSPAIEQLRRTIDQLGETDVDILIEGETGSGKTLVATLLHRSSRRRGRPLSTVDCGALPTSIVDSELFGHVAGAFPGAQYSRTGRIETAEFGTLFLDGIHTLPLEVQPKLLRAIDERLITPLGSDIQRQVDFRLIASSTIDLSQLVVEQRFLPALLYRLNGVVLRLPPLRDRREDIPLLFDHFVQEAASRLKRPALAMTRSHWAMLAEHDWPGNVRELIHYAERVVLGVEEHPSPAEKSVSLAERVSQFEAAQLRRALADHAGHVGRTCAALGVPRKTFYDKLNRYQINPAEWRRGN